jgi:hypothetical protein
MPTRALKMKSSLPFNLESRLVSKWGYAVDKRVPGEFIIFKKTYVSDTKVDDGLRRTIRASVNDNKIVYPSFKAELNAGEKKALEKRCDNIVNFFPDPYSVPESVRARLKIAMQHSTPLEAQYILEYMDENFPPVDKGT